MPSERKSRGSASGAAAHTQNAPSPAKPSSSERGTANTSASTQPNGAASTSWNAIRTPTIAQAPR